MISFNKPPYVGEEIKYIEEAVKAQKICGDGFSTTMLHISLVCKEMA